MSHSDGQGVLYDSRAVKRGQEKASVKAIRPKFDRPPLVEQAITVVFDELAGFSIGDFGRFWALIENEFPVCDQGARLPTAVEHLGGPRAQQEINLVLGGAAVIPRSVYRSAAGDELLQVQGNRFSFNWAKLGGAPYPHSDRTVKRFVEHFQIFEGFVAGHGLGPIKLLQCEITNVNIVPVADFGGSFADAPLAFAVRPFSPEGGFLKPETYTQNLQSLIAVDGVPRGRLHVTLAPVINTDDETQAYKLEITARSGQGVSTLEEVLIFFDTARSAINSAFLELTARDMWAKWGIRNG